MSDQQPPASGEAPLASSSQPLDELRDILIRSNQEYLTLSVQSVLDEAMERKIDEAKDRMATVLAPVLGEAIRHQINQAQDDIVDALYPVIGKAIQRSVAEAMRSLARRVDEGLRGTFSANRLLRRLQARIRGIPESELVLREALPCRVREVFLIHRESGVLLHHLSRDPQPDPDRDLIGSMLTAIRDFAADSFGNGREGDLDAIQYGDLSIVVEPGPWAYLAVVIQGFEPEGYRHRMRTLLSDVHRAHSAELEEYAGDASVLAGVEATLQPLLMADPAQPEAQGERRSPWLAVSLVGVVLLLCLSAACFGAWRLTWGRPQPTATITATSTPTPAPSSTAATTPTPQPAPTSTVTRTPTATHAFSPTPAPTATLVPTATFVPTAIPTSSPPPYVAVMIGNVWLRAVPSETSTLTGARADQGRPVEVLAVYGAWYLVRWPPGDPGGTAGWVPARWVGIVAAPPLDIITPAP